MGDAEPQAAEGMCAEDIEKALDVLRLLWGDEYMFGFDPEHGWWVIKNGHLISLLTADSPERLGKVLADEAGTGPS
jgi:hypothetical protein